VLAGKLVDVTLHASLRPAALVVAARLLVEEVGELLEPAGAEAVEAALLAPDDDHEGSLAAPEERHERGKVELPAHSYVVRYGLGERKRAPDVVEPGAEDREAVGAVAAELLLEVAADAVEIGLEPLPLVVRQRGAVGPVGLGGLVEE
jgi:hypothetical protein